MTCSSVRPEQSERRERAAPACGRALAGLETSRLEGGNTAVLTHVCAATGIPGRAEHGTSPQQDPEGGLTRDAAVGSHGGRSLWISSWDLVGSPLTLSLGFARGARGHVTPALPMWHRGARDHVTPAPSGYTRAFEHATRQSLQLGEISISKVENRSGHIRCISVLVHADSDACLSSRLPTSTVQ
jgi:hypothetical protein